MHGAEHEWRLTNNVAVRLNDATFRQLFEDIERESRNGMVGMALTGQPYYSLLMRFRDRRRCDLVRSSV